MMEDSSPTPRRNNTWVGLGILTALCLGVVSFTAGYFSHKPEKLPQAPVAVAEQAQPEALEAAVVEKDSALADLQERQAKVESLESLLADREAELAALKAQDVRDEARRAEAQKKWRAMEAEIAQLRTELAQVEAERDQLRGELKQALADLDAQIAATDHARSRARVYKKASDQNLWFAFLNNAKVQICDKGTRRAHDKCHSAVDSFFDKAAQDRFAACVGAQQAVPVLKQTDGKEAALPKHSVALPDDNRFTKKGWYVLYCDPTLPEAVAQDDIDAAPQTFAQLER